MAARQLIPRSRSLSATIAVPSTNPSISITATATPTAVTAASVHVQAQTATQGQARLTHSRSHSRSASTTSTPAVPLMPASTGGTVLPSAIAEHGPAHGPASTTPSVAEHIRSQVPRFATSPMTRWTQFALLGLVQSAPKPPVHSRSQSATTDIEPQSPLSSPASSGAATPSSASWSARASTPASTPVDGYHDAVASVAGRQSHRNARPRHGHATVAAVSAGSTQDAGASTSAGASAGSQGQPRRRRHHSAMDLQPAVKARYELHDRASGILAAIKAHHRINESLLSVYSELYQDVARSTKVFGRRSLRDPAWGLLPSEGLISEEDCREHLMGELVHMMRGVEREIEDLLPAGLSMTPIGRMFLPTVTDE